VDATIDLNLISTYSRVVEAGSFTAAAHSLGVPTSTVSRAVARLEEELGVRLLQRTTRKLAPTEAGLRYYERVRNALHDLGEANEAAADLGQAPRGTVRVTAPSDLAVPMLAEIVGRFCARHPLIRIELSFDNRRVDLVAEGFDLALRAGTLDDSTLVGRRVADSELAVFGAPSYLARRGRPRTVAALAQHDCILLRSRSQGLLPWRLVGPDGVDEVEVKGSLIADDFGFVRVAVAAGLGLGLLPNVELPIASDGGLVRLLPRHAIREGGLYVLSPSSRHVPLRVALFRDHLIEELGQLRERCQAHRKKAS
jgi:DNA-binding transcriptional LysR family regulator